ncbi:hypothetical protein [Mycobacterium sp. URHB0044]|nr:hypothetical protein [Mycobacterium sp. URHB0044]
MPNELSSPSPIKACVVDYPNQKVLLVIAQLAGDGLARRVLQ